MSVTAATVLAELTELMEVTAATVLLTGGAVVDFTGVGNEQRLEVLVDTQQADREGRPVSGGSSLGQRLVGAHHVRRQRGDRGA